MTGSDEYVVADPRAFGPVIRAVRDDRGVRQVELAQRTGINRSRISNLENGDNNEAIRQLLLIFATLDHEVVIRPKEASR